LRNKPKARKVDGIYYDENGNVYKSHYALKVNPNKPQYTKLVKRDRSKPLSKLVSRMMK
jgi:hypothetical protein